MRSTSLALAIGVILLFLNVNVHSEPTKDGPAARTGTVLLNEVHGDRVSDKALLTSNEMRDGELVEEERKINLSRWKKWTRGHPFTRTREYTKVSCGAVGTIPTDRGEEEGREGGRTSQERKATKSKGLMSFSQMPTICSSKNCLLLKILTSNDILAILYGTVNLLNQFSDRIERQASDRSLLRSVIKV